MVSQPPPRGGKSRSVYAFGYKPASCPEASSARADFGAALPCSPAERSLSAGLPSPLLPTSATLSTFLPEGTSPVCDTRPQSRPPDSVLTLPLRLPYRGPLGATLVPPRARCWPPTTSRTRTRPPLAFPVLEPRSAARPSATEIGSRLSIASDKSLRWQPPRPSLVNWSRAQLSSRHRASSRRGGPRCAARATSRRCLDRWLARSARKSCPSPSPRT